MRVVLNYTGEAGKAGNGKAIFVAASPTLTSVTSVAKSYTADRQQELLKAFQGEDGNKINAKQNLVTSSDGSQMVTGTNKVACKCGQKDAQNQCYCFDLRLSNCSCHLFCSPAVKVALLLPPALPASPA